MGPRLGPWAPLFKGSFKGSMRVSKRGKISSLFQDPIRDSLFESLMFKGFRVEDHGLLSLRNR